MPLLGSQVSKTRRGKEFLDRYCIPVHVERKNFDLALTRRLEETARVREVNIWAFNVSVSQDDNE
jgi:hypothetical protein